MVYNGWKNRETWNVVLWMLNDFQAYQVSKAYKKYPQPFLSFRDDLKKGWFKASSTPDGVSLWDTKLDIPALDEAMREA